MCEPRASLRQEWEVWLEREARRGSDRYVFLVGGRAALGNLRVVLRTSLTEVGRRSALSAAKGLPQAVGECGCRLGEGFLANIGGWKGLGSGEKKVRETEPGRERSWSAGFTVRAGSRSCGWKTTAVAGVGARGVLHQRGRGL